MICGEAKNYMQRLIDGQLSDQDANVLRAHMKQCPSCALAWDQLKELDSILAKSLLMPELPPGFLDSVMASIKNDDILPAGQTEKDKKVLPRATVWKRFGLIAAAIITVVGVSAYSLWQNQESGAPPVQVADVGNVGAEDTAPDAQQPDTTPADTNPGDVPDPDPAESDAQTSANTRPDTSQDPADTPKSTQTNTEDPHSGSVDLPQVAYNSVSSGAFKMVLLADHAGLSVLNPQVADDTVFYYVKSESGYQKWQQKLDPDSLPTLVEDNAKFEKVAALSTSNGIYWLDGKNYVLAYSTDGAMIAANIEDEGLGVSYNTPDAGGVIVSEEGGGNLLQWSPNSAKIAYTDAQGNLRVYYIAEKKDVLVFSGAVSAVDWSWDSKMIVIAGRGADDTADNLYRVIVP